MTVYEKLFKVQQALKAPKGKTNDFGHYNYRSAEDILEAVKPILEEQGVIIILSDEIFHIDGQTIKVVKGDTSKEVPYNYIEASATIVSIEDGQKVTVKAYARECEHTGMSADQCTGCASSYARKYALNGLLAIDNTKDSDDGEITKRDAEEKKQAWEKFNKPAQQSQTEVIKRERKAR